MDKFRQGQTWYNRYDGNTYVHDGDGWRVLRPFEDSKYAEPPRLPAGKLRITKDPAVFIYGEPEFVGSMPVRQDIEVLSQKDHGRLALGWTVQEITGIAIVNPGAVSIGTLMDPKKKDLFWKSLEGKME